MNSSLLSVRERTSFPGGGNHIAVLFSEGKASLMNLSDGSTELTMTGSDSSCRLEMAI
ncbi:hypothetical protein MARINOS108_10985 [Marinoscillum sp. 108]|nr:hypothetical protein MARINOS108_10985 [Marinoscillum sp. 108]